MADKRVGGGATHCAAAQATPLSGGDDGHYPSLIQQAKKPVRPPTQRQTCRSDGMHQLSLSILVISTGRRAESLPPTPLNPSFCTHAEPEEAQAHRSRQHHHRSQQNGCAMSL